MAYSNFGGGGGGGGGGGYGQNQYGGDAGGGFMGGSQGGSQGNKGGYDKETLRPLTIMQATTASEPYPGADFKVDDVDLKHLSLIGQIRNISKQATNITYKLDDGTGTVEVKVWIDAEAPTHDDEGKPVDPRSGRAGLEEGMWAKVYGKMKSFNNRTHVAAFKVRPVTDYNEVTHHLLEAAYVHLFFSRDPPEQAGGGQGGVDGAAQGGAGAAAAQAGAGGQVDLAGGRNMPSMGNSAKKVLNTLYNTPQGNEGLHVQMISQHSGLPVQEVMKGGDELMNHGLIFTTVDDMTWALLEN